MPKSIRALCILAALTLVGVGLFTSHELSDPRWLTLLGGSWILLLIGTRITLPAETPTVGRAMVRTAMVLTTIFAVIAAQLARVQVVQRSATYNKVETTKDGFTFSNPRKTGTSLTEQRGRIYDRNGELIADTQKDGDIYKRVYPNPVTAYVAGYYSPLLYGADGLEETYSQQLTGQSEDDSAEKLIDGLLHRDGVGLDLHLTLDSGLQQTATDQLQGRKGAAVVMEIETGAILVLASNPNYDPNKLFTTSSSESVSGPAGDYWESLNKDPDAPFVLRPNLGLYTPGSTFKTVTASAAIDSGLAKPDDIYQD
ncbi:MAG TPA: penicillin-binding transpeptidase domain-containing protein, partial [Thermomicrobiales bacterium]|nr:penicillin-binding transpeptidase domain-containing protein [Thermomicrobiales bacterium]